MLESIRVGRSGNGSDFLGGKIASETIVHRITRFRNWQRGARDKIAEVETGFQRPGLLDGKTIFCQSAGFVGSDRSDHADGLDGAKFFDESLFSRHPRSAYGENDGSSNRQIFRNGRDDECEGKLGGFEERNALDKLNDEHNSGDDEDGGGDFDDEFVDFFLDWADGGGARSKRGDVTVFGVVPRGDNDHFSGAGNDKGARKDHVFLLENLFHAGNGASVLGDGLGLAGEHGFVGEDARFNDDATVSGDAIAFVEEDDVARDKLDGIEFDFFAATESFDFVGSLALQIAENALGGKLLEIEDAGVTENVERDNQHLGPRTLENGEKEGDKQNNHEEVAKRFNQLPPERDFLQVEVVFAVFFLATGDFFARKAFLWVDFKFLEDFFHVLIVEFCHLSIIT